MESPYDDFDEEMPRDDNETSEAARELIDRILLWANDVPNFDTTFVETMQDSLDEYGYLTNAQFVALETIIEKWRVE